MDMFSRSHTPTANAPAALRLLPCADTLGIAASTLCVIHCLAMPLVVMAAPALAPHIVHDDRTHYLLAFFVTAFCLLAVVPGYLRHNQKPVLLMMSFGLGLVLLATFGSAHLFGEQSELPLITLGNLLVVAAHYSNRRLLACAH